MGDAGGGNDAGVPLRVHVVVVGAGGCGDDNRGADLGACGSGRCGSRGREERASGGTGGDALYLRRAKGDRNGKATGMGERGDVKQRQSEKGRDRGRSYTVRRGVSAMPKLGMLLRVYNNEAGLSQKSRVDYLRSTGRSLGRMRRQIRRLRGSVLFATSTNSVDH